jgi:molybdopterin converting factor small subunit
MTVRVRLPRVLTDTAAVAPRHEASGSTLGEVLEDLFATAPRLRRHLLDEEGRIRPHVLIFVDSVRSDLDTPVREDADVQVLQAVSGG